MGIQLITFGGLHVESGDCELDQLRTQRSRAALLVYLGCERHVSRDTLMAVFWPESDTEDARHALRQGLYHLRKALGCDWLLSLEQEIIVRPEVAADATAMAAAAERGDAERVFRLYRGPFLEGIHLIDVQPWESWVDGRRARYARLFRRACRELLDLRTAVRDHAGAIDVAERWASLEPTDDEAQHRLIATLAAAGERTEAIRQYETYSRLLAPEGLEPLDETRTLVERLRGQRDHSLPPRPTTVARAPVIPLRTRKRLHPYWRQFSAFTRAATHWPSDRPLRFPD